MFNVRIFKYSHSGYQVRIYDFVIGGDVFDDVFARREIDPDKNDGDNSLVLMENPFTNELEWVRDLDKITDDDFVKDAERSAHNSMCRSKNNIFYLARSNTWDWFITLTFNPEKVNSFDYDEVTKKLSKWLNNCKRKSPDMRYLVVPEQHESGRWHFHGLFSCCDELCFTDTGKRTKKNEPIYNLDVYRLGFSTATKVTSTEKVSKYISKYITKDVCLSIKGKRRYWCSKNLERAEFQDVLLTAEEKERFLQFFSDDISHIKFYGSKDLGLGVTYIELHKGVEFDL